MDEFERVWIDYVIPVTAFSTSILLFRQKPRDVTSIFFGVLLAVSSILMALNTLSKLGLL